MDANLLSFALEAQRISHWAVEAKHRPRIVLIGFSRPKTICQWAVEAQNYSHCVLEDQNYSHRALEALSDSLLGL